MTKLEIAAQIISIFGMSMNVLSYQQKNKKRVIIFQFFGASLFAVSFFMLRAYVGAILNIIAVIRAVVYMDKERFRADKSVWLYAFCAAYFVTYALTFTVLDKEPTIKNLAVELLPIIGMIATTVSFRLSDAAAIRRLGLISSPSWLIYNIACFSIGAILCETFSIVSIILGIIRFDITKSSTEKSKK